MASKDKYAELADAIVAAVGGKDNISYFVHCVTRLRFSLKDKGLLKEEELNSLKGVLGSQWSGDQFQVIIGQAVGDVYASICARTGLAAESAIDEDLGDAPKKKFSITTVLDAISGSVAPLVNVLIGCGFIKIIVMLCEQFGLLTPGDPTHTVLSFAGDAGFYFLPILIGANAAKKFGADPCLGMLMGAMLLHPNFSDAVAGGQALSIFGLPVYPAMYSSSVIPAILACAVMAPIERYFARISPDSIRSITEPLLTLLVMIPLNLCLLAPLGSILGNYLSTFIMWLYDVSGGIGVAFFTCFCPWLVLTGMHTALMPYVMSALAKGFEPLVSPGMLVSNVNQGIACLVVSLKSKNKELKSTAASCAITAVVGGVTEPAMFSVTLQHRKAMYGAMVGSLAGGLVLGLNGVGVHTMTGSGGILSLAGYLGGDSMNIVWAAVAVAVGAVATFIATWMLYKPEEA